MPFIAKVSESGGVWSIDELKQGSYNPVPPGWVKVTETPIQAEPLKEVTGAPELSISPDGTTVTLYYPVHTLPTPMQIMNMKTYTSQKRWQVETAGTTVDLGGLIVAVPTDRDGRTALKQARDMLRDGELLDVNDNPLTETDVVVDSIPAVLNEAALTAMIQAAGKHVQLAFTAQKDVIAGIDAGTITSKSDIDGYGWP